MEKMLANGYDSGLVDAPDFTTGVKNLPILSHSGCLPVPPWRALGDSLVLLQEGSSWLWPGFCDQIRLHLEHTGHNKALRDQGQSCPSWRNQVINNEIPIKHFFFKIPQGGDVVLHWS